MAMMHDLRTLKNAAWLGWQMEANWTDPFLFGIYSIVRPISAALILVFMYMVVTGGNTDNAYFSYMFVGNALYMYVAEVLFGVTWVIHDDREHYMTLKQVYIAPVKFYSYILGRSAIKIAITSAGVLITLLFGVVVLGVRIDITNIDWLLLAASIVIGMSCISVLGLALGGVTFLTAKHSIGINEGVAGIFYVLSGVIFPITALPVWGQAISKFLPVTYWMDLMRRSIMPEAMTDINTDAGMDVTGLSTLSDLYVLAFLAVSAVIFFVVSIGIFRYADYMARKKGKIDWTTAY